MTVLSCPRPAYHLTRLNRVTAIGLVFFLLTAAGPTASCNWLCNFFSATTLTVPDQPNSQTTTPLKPSEAESDFDFSKNLLFFSPELSPLSLAPLSVRVAASYFHPATQHDHLWRTPACPRPPPHPLVRFRCNH
ncbi:MAG: hypothetical protein JXR59_11475 [Desulfuromonadaceae bacterium]|nr:hypothetical protein [Desulfuromonadaceae bacterium]